MIWVANVGRKSGLVDATPSYVREVIGDARRAGVLVARHLDLPHSQLEADPPVWALAPIGVAGIQVRPAVAVRLKDAPAGLLLRSEAVAGFDPTRLTADLDLISENGSCRLVARWDAAVELSIPRLARKPAGQLVGRILTKLMDELLEQLRAATH